MFKSLFAVVASLIAMNTAHATSLHPCTPSIPAEQTYISCQAGEDAVIIRINTTMSDRQICPYEQYIEYKSAQVEVRDSSGTIVRTYEIGNGDFEYDLGPAYFKSEKYGLNLKNCFSPINGGVSFGN